MQSINNGFAEYYSLTEEDVPWRRICIHGRYVESEAFERQSSPLGAYFLGKRYTSVEKTIKNTVALLVSN